MKIIPGADGIYRLYYWSGHMIEAVVSYIVSTLFTMGNDQMSAYPII